MIFPITPNLVLKYIDASSVLKNAFMNAKLALNISWRAPNIYDLTYM